MRLFSQLFRQPACQDSNCINPPLSSAIREARFAQARQCTSQPTALVPAPSLCGCPREQWCVRRPPSDVSWPPSHPRRGPLPAQSTGPQARTPHLAAKTGQGVRRASSPTTLLLCHNAAHQLTPHCTGDQDAQTPPGTQPRFSKSSSLQNRSSP